MERTIWERRPFISLFRLFLRKTALPILLNRENRGSALKHWAFFEKSQYWPRQKTLDYQWLKLKEILDHAYRTTAYYKRKFEERGLTPDSIRNFDDLMLLPILTRRDIFESARQMISDKYDVGSIQEVLTGGTTGQQATLYRDQESFNIKLGMQWRHEGWMGRKPCDRMAYIWPVHFDLHDAESWKSRLKNRLLLGDSVYFAGNYNDKLYRAFYDDIMKFRPEFMKAFPAPLENFTEFILDKKLRPPRLKGIMSTGEPLYENQRKLFSETYSCPIFDLYASREVGNSASECDAHQGLHIAMETSLIEFTRDGRQIDEGEEGEILITDLTNYAFPIIRYQINDFGALLKKRCSCGRELPLMSPGVGRLQDFFYTPDGRKQSGLTLAVHISADQKIRVGQIQIIQTKLDEFRVRITDRPTPTEDTFVFIRSRMMQMIGENIKISIEVVKELPKEKSGKTRFVICEIEKPEGAK
jgi:phenylacetate-CoA ligase